MSESQSRKFHEKAVKEYDTKISELLDAVGDAKDFGLTSISLNLRFMWSAICMVSGQIEGLKDKQLSKREKLAAMAMQGHLANYHARGESGPQDTAKHALNCADALLAELDKESK